MDHPLAPHELSGAVPLGRLELGLVVDNHGGDSLMVRFLVPLKATARVVPLPARFRIVDYRDKVVPIKPDERRWITADTRDPRHAIVFLTKAP